MGWMVWKRWVRLALAAGVLIACSAEEREGSDATFSSDVAEADTGSSDTGSPDSDVGEDTPEPGGGEFEPYVPLPGCPSQDLSGPFELQFQTDLNGRATTVRMSLEADDTNETCFSGVWTEFSPEGDETLATVESILGTFDTGIVIRVRDYQGPGGLVADLTLELNYYSGSSAFCGDLEMVSTTPVPLSTTGTYAAVEAGPNPQLDINGPTCEDIEPSGG